MKKPKVKKYSLREISKAWKKLYGESIRTEYSGFYEHLKNNKA